MLPYGYYLESGSPFTGRKLREIRRLLSSLSLDYDEAVEHTTAIFTPGHEAIATASLQGNILKCIGISPNHQGGGLTAALMTALLEVCSRNGHDQQFLYTKPQNARLFQPFGFSALAETETALLMERPQGGIHQFLSALPKVPEHKRIGAIVAHCNPITIGHLYLIEQALAMCDHLYVFILSEDQGEIPAADRLNLVKEALSGHDRVTVCPTGQYLISNATFPSYFIKDAKQVSKAWCILDATMFARWFAPALRISCRFVGTEPFSPITAAYNQTLHEILPASGIQVVELERKVSGSQPVSASRVRKLIRENRMEELMPLVPACTLRYLLDPASSAVARRRIADKR